MCIADDSFSPSSLSSLQQPRIARVSRTLASVEGMEPSVAAPQQPARFSATAPAADAAAASTSGQLVPGPAPAKPIKRIIHNQARAARMRLS